MSSYFFASKWIVAAFLVATLAGCVTPPPPPWPQLKSRLERLVDWRVEARMSLRSPQGNATLWVDWRQRGELWRLCFRDILGRGLLCADGDRERAVLRYPNRTPQTLARAELEAWQPIPGLTLPVVALPLWLKGLPSTTSEPSFVVALPATLSELGWEIRWSAQRRHRRRAAAVWLPGRLDLKHDATQVRLRGMRWKLGVGAS